MRSDSGFARSAHCLRAKAACGTLKNRARSISIALFLPVLLAAGSCSLLPVEEEAPPPPVIRSYEKTDYSFAYVSRGDILETVRVSCQYTPARQENLAFPVGGVPVTAVYFEKGDMVSAGDIIAELDREQILSRIEAQKFEITKLELEKKTADNNYAIQKAKLESEKAQILSDLADGGDSENQEAAEKNQARVGQLDAQLESLATSYLTANDILVIKLGLARDKLSELETSNSDRLLVAPFDGTITQLKNVEAGTVSTENETFAIISDKSTSVFTVSGKNAEYFAVGDRVDIMLSSTLYAAEVIDPGEYGVEDTGTVYIRLEEYIPDIKDRATGSITLTLNEKLGVLRLSSGAIKTLNGESIVYYLNDSGIRDIKVIKTGFSAGGTTEIISGLEEGDEVIME